MRELSLSIITAPRLRATLQLSMQSIRHAGHQGVINIFSEPGEYDFRDQGVRLFPSEAKLGCFRNFHRAFSWNARQQHFFCVLSDDFVYKKGVWKMVAKLLDYESYRAIYTPAGMRFPPCNFREKGWRTFNLGWANTYGGHYCMHSELARRIIAHPRYQDHLKNYAKNQQVDHIIPEVCYQLGVNQFYHNPSFCDHIGKTSTIGHQWNNSEGMNFR